MGASASLSVLLCSVNPQDLPWGRAALKQCPHDVTVLITGLVVFVI